MPLLCSVWHLRVSDDCEEYVVIIGVLHPVYKSRYTGTSWYEIKKEPSNHED